ncbi:MAG: helix-turn-helix domain-containing protein [Eubacteriales bacterium]
MLSNQLLQSTISQFKVISSMDFRVYDTLGNCVVSTIDVRDDLRNVVIQFTHSNAESQEVYHCYFFRVMIREQIEYVLEVDGNDQQAYLIGQMVSFQLSSLLVAYNEKFNKENYMKDLLLDNLLKIDIYSRAKKLEILSDVKRLAIIIEPSKGEDSQLIDLLGECEYLEKDFVTAIEEPTLVIVKELQEGTDRKAMEKQVVEIKQYIQQAGYEGVRISYGTIANDLREVSASYKEAKMALDVGKIFFEERSMIAYSELGIGRLIYQLPIPLCNMFIKEIFHEKSLEEIDEETRRTIMKFFENNLNVSETSRQLFIHRNTLVYRLDKLQKSTNLDLRIFDDAITFKIAMMVVKYMKYVESYQY